MSGDNRVKIIIANGQINMDVNGVNAATCKNNAMLLLEQLAPRHGSVEDKGAEVDAVHS